MLLPVFQKTKPATEKNLGRVASGKRLAERNRLARKAKKQAESAKTQNAAASNSTSETTTNPTNSATTNSSNSSGSNSGYLILVVGGLIVSVLGVYYQREAIKQKEPAPTAPPAATPAEGSTPSAEDSTPVS